VAGLLDQFGLAERVEREPGWQALRRINREFVAWVLEQAEPGRSRPLGRTEGFLDDTPIEVSGPSFEGAAVNYEGHLALSWQVLLVGSLLADQVLGATSDTQESPASDPAGKDVSHRLPELLAANAHLWSKAESYLSTDSASSAGKYLDTIAEHWGAGSGSDNQWAGPLEAKAAELPEAAWSAGERTRWRDGSEHLAQQARFRYQPGGGATPKRFGVVRHRAAGEMFWRYAFVTTQEQDGPAWLAFEHHRLKGDKERLLSEPSSDLDLPHPPCLNLNANRSFYPLAGFAWNLLQALKLLHLPEGEAPKRLRTLVRPLLLVPVEWKRPARRLQACLYAPAGWGAGGGRGVAGGRAAALPGVERRERERFGLRQHAEPRSPMDFRRPTPLAREGCARPRRRNRPGASGDGPWQIPASLLAAPPPPERTLEPGDVARHRFDPRSPPSFQVGQDSG
jgi:hypothetical protein